MRERRVGQRHALTMLVAALILACEPGAVTYEADPIDPPPPDSTGNPVTVQRTTLGVRVAFDAESAEIASLAGVTVGGLTVRLTRRASADAPRAAVTDAEGKVAFSGLLAGTYDISVDRALTQAELDRLPPETRDASLFAGGYDISLGAQAAEVPVLLVATRRGSLVVSQVFVKEYAGFSGVSGQYMEIFNNGDTTAYLDGLWYFSSHMHNRPCFAERLDPAGLLVNLIYRFPGTGREHPVLPGRATVVAMNAADGRPNGEGFHDLSAAEFEFIGTLADPNNPFSADMIPIKGIVEGVSGPGFGSGFHGLARAVASDTLGLQRGVSNESGGWSFFTIPRTAVIDLLGAEITPETNAIHIGVLGYSTLCEPRVAPEFDRSLAPLYDRFFDSAVSRKTATLSPDGREILQRTGNSSRDFQLADPLRRSLRRSQ